MKPLCANKHQRFVGVPYQFKGRGFDGADCVGIAQLWLGEVLGVQTVDTVRSVDCSQSDLDKLLHPMRPGELEVGAVVFLRSRILNRISHVVVHVGEDRFLTASLHGSRIDNGLELLRRCNYEAAGWIGPGEVEALSRALASPGLTSWMTLIFAIISIAASMASGFLLKPKFPKFRNESGRYSFGALVTATNTELPLPDVLGRVQLAGNAVFQSRLDKNQTVTDATLQRITRLVVLSVGPAEDILGVRINGLNSEEQVFGTESGKNGFHANPAQTKAEAWQGIIPTYTQAWSTISFYPGGWVLDPVVDIRAHYDRAMPVYPLNGSAYLALRFIDATKFESGLNVTATLKGRKCRTFTGSGFDQTTVTGESVAGADGAKTRFKLAQSDIASVASLTVNAVAQTELSETNQGPSNVYHLNRTKGIITFLTAPANAATITITYNYYPRAWTQNPVNQVVHLLTDAFQGKGFDESRIDFVEAVAARDYCDASVTWRSSNGLETGARYTSNYAVDFRKPLNEHVEEVLNTFAGYLYVANGKVKIRARKAAASVFSFNESNILVGTFSSELLDRSNRANRVHIFYHSKDSLHAEDGIRRGDPTDQRDREPRLGNRGGC